MGRNSVTIATGLIVGTDSIWDVSGLVRSGQPSRAGAVRPSGLDRYSKPFRRVGQRDQLRVTAVRAGLHGLIITPLSACSSNELAVPLPRCGSIHRQCEMERAAFSIIRFDPQAPAMCLNDRATNGQTDAHPFRLRRHKGLEQFCLDLLRDTASGIRDADQYLVGARCGTDFELTSLSSFHGFQCVTNEIQQNL